MSLIDVETAEKIFAIERLVWRYAGLKEVRVRTDLDVSMTRYYQLINDLIDTELALQLDAATTYRLRRKRTAGRRLRSARPTSVA